MLRFFGKCLSFYYDNVITNFWPCFGNPEARTWTAVKKQEEKIILKIKKQEQEIKTILNKDHVQGFQI